MANITRRIKALGTSLLYTGLSMGLGALINCYSPPPKIEQPKTPQGVITTYKDTNNNGLYDTVERKFPNGTTTEKRLGWIEVVYDEHNNYKIVPHYREVTRKMIEEEQQPYGLETIVIE